MVALLLVGLLSDGRLGTSESGLGVLGRSQIGSEKVQEDETHVRLVPLSEGGSVDVDNGTLDEGLGSEKLVVGGVVSLITTSAPSTSSHSLCPLHSFQLREYTHNLDQPSLPGDRLGTPSKVTGVESESPVLDVTASGSDLMDTFGRVKLGHGGLTTKFELSLLSAKWLHQFFVQWLRGKCNTLVGTTSTGGGALVARVTSDTHSAKTGQSQASIIL